MPQVLNYKHGAQPGPDCVYIGRPMPRYGLCGSKWQTPYKIFAALVWVSTSRCRPRRIVSTRQIETFARFLGREAP
jgi:hypothetical protein